MEKKVVVSLQNDEYKLEGSKISVFYDAGNGLQPFSRADNDTKAFALLVHYLSFLNSGNLPKFDKRTLALKLKHIYKDYETAKTELSKNRVKIYNPKSISTYYDNIPTADVFDLINNLKNALNDSSMACPLYFTYGEQTLLLNEEALSQLKGISTDKKDEETLNEVFNLVDGCLSQTLGGSTKAK